MRGKDRETQVLTEIKKERRSKQGIKESERHPGN
jgi:hypothetical protein